MSSVARSIPVPSFQALVQAFFAEHLSQQRAMSPRTVAAYRDAFMLFLDYIQAHHAKPPANVKLADLTLDPATRVLLRTRPSPLTWDQALTIRGARPAGPPPRPSTEPVTAQRRASSTGVIMVAGQKIALGRIHAGQVVTVHAAAETIAIDLGEDTRTVRRTTTQPRASAAAA